MERPQGRKQPTEVPADMYEGDIITFIMAGQIEAILPNGFVKLVDEDGFSHEVPGHILRQAHDRTKDRFVRKRERQPRGQDPVPAREAPRVTTAPENANVDAVPRHERPRGRPERRGDDRRGRRDRRDQKRWGG